MTQNTQQDTNNFNHSKWQRGQLRRFTIPVRQYRRDGVCVKLGRLTIKDGKNREACETFEEMRKVSPDRISGLEYYSTALWHLRKEVELSHLAKVASELDRFCPETWIIVGNCFSLQQEHENSIKFFKRALQIRESNAYACTLLAHEYVKNEDFDKALTGFRNAIRHDPRHYVAWYGLGNIYNRQDNFKLAAYHLLKAYKLNSQSPVLCEQIGMLFRNQGGYSQKALQWLDKAVRLNEKVPSQGFKRHLCTQICEIIRRHLKS
eukprot:TRINITY_DN2163_c0_g1_i1.p1 TRINITY_DN2163_c0_g1~~TRINITY_DN2163_c0_g1_i1.p1  ORF type:complete len:263 (+),score=32.36 TRINITY_DN2163_c0_g1_i1:162-950(+)